MATIKPRGYTEADWLGAQGDPVLADREIGFITDTGEYVLGDGATDFSGLTRYGGPGSATYQAQLDQVVVGAGGQATIDFTSIPATYEDLIVRIHGRTEAAGVSDEVTATFNNDTASNYDRQLLSIFGSTTAAGESLGTTSMRAGLLPGDGAPASYGGQVEFLINSYARTVFTKTISSRGSRAQSTSANGLLAWIYAGHWRSNAAINRITLAAAADFKEGTVATLIGSGPLA